MSDYLLRIHIESPDTMHTAPNGQESESDYGHVWYEIIKPDGSTLQAGFGPLDPKSGPSSVPGSVSFDDGTAYAGTPYFTATYRVTAEQAATLENYRFNPETYGFDKDNYHALTNSCVDFVWKGLNTIGMNPTGFQGELKPTDNAEKFSLLNNPAFAGGGLLMIQKDHGQSAEYFNTENAGYWGEPWWNGSSDPGWIDQWLDAADNFGINVVWDLPQGNVSWPASSGGENQPWHPSSQSSYSPDQDGTNYNQDGTAYQ